MMNTRSQDAYIRLGKPGQTRVDGERGRWYVEACDKYGVWVLAEPGVRYQTKREAAEAAKEIAQPDGTVKKTAVFAHAGFVLAASVGLE